MANKRTSGTLSRLPERTYGLICSVVTPTDLYGTSEYLKANHISNRHHFEQPFSTNVMTSHIATPNAHTSVLSENIFFVRLSFAMYRIGSRASRSSFQKSSPCCRYRACPKSPSLSTLFSPTRMFLTAMSRCSMRFCQTCELFTDMHAQVTSVHLPGKQDSQQSAQPDAAARVSAASQNDAWPFAACHQDPCTS